MSYYAYLRAQNPAYNNYSDSEITSAVHSLRPEYTDYSADEISKALSAMDDAQSAQYHSVFTGGRSSDKPVQKEENGVLGDIWDSGVSGFLSMPQGDAEFVHTFTGDPVSGFAAQKLGESVDARQSGMSKAGREASQKEFIHEDESGKYSAGDAWTDPRAFANVIASGLGSVAAMIATGGPLKHGFTYLLKKGMTHTVDDFVQQGATRQVAEDMAKKRLEKIERGAAAAGYGLAEGAAVGGLTSKDIEDRYAQLTDDQITSAPIFEGLYQASKESNPTATHEELFAQSKAELLDGLKQEGALLAGSSSAVLGAVFGPYIEKVVFGKAKSANRFTGAGKGAIAEGIPESLQGGTEQYVASSVLSQVDPTINPMQGVANAAVTEGIGGFSAGGILGGVASPAKSIAEATTVDEVISAAEQIATSIDYPGLSSSTMGPSVSAPDIGTQGPAVNYQGLPVPAYVPEDIQYPPPHGFLGAAIPAGFDSGTGTGDFTVTDARALSKTPDAQAARPGANDGKSPGEAVAQAKPPGGILAAAFEKAQQEKQKAEQVEKIDSRVTDIEDATKQAERKADNFVDITNKYGDPIRVRQADLDKPNAKFVRIFTKDGKSKGTIHPDNIARTDADLNENGITRKALSEQGIKRIASPKTEKREAWLTKQGYSPVRWDGKEFNPDPAGEWAKISVKQTAPNLTQDPTSPSGATQTKEQSNELEKPDSQTENLDGTVTTDTGVSAEAVNNLPLELAKIKADAESDGISARRIQSRLMDAVKKAGMLTDDGLPTPEAQNLVRKTLGQAPRDTSRGFHGLTKTATGNLSAPKEKAAEQSQQPDPGKEVQAQDSITRQEKPKSLAKKDAGLVKPVAKKAADITSVSDADFAAMMDEASPPKETPKPEDAPPPNRADYKSTEAHIEATKQWRKDKGLTGQRRKPAKPVSLSSIQLPANDTMGGTESADVLLKKADERIAALQQLKKCLST